jgi:SAM-dependent methyltransferase
MHMASPQARSRWAERQQKLYAQRYARFRALHDFLRYDARYRLLLMEELFRAHAIPFEHQRVFELGFGTGSLLLRFDSTCVLHGSEISESAVRALAGDPRVASYREIALRLAAQDGTPVFPARDYDVVIASHVLEHVPDDQHTLRLLAQHTAEQGHGLFFLPVERPRHNPDHARVYTAAGFTRLLRASGWEPVHVAENFRYASHLVQVVNWPSRARIPLLGPLVEAAKSALLALPPTAFVRLVEEPLEKLHVAPYQLMVLARKASVRAARVAAPRRLRARGAQATRGQGRGRESAA